MKDIRSKRYYTHIKLKLFKTIIPRTNDVCRENGTSKAKIMNKPQLTGNP